MMFALATDKSLFKKFWEDEQTLPRHFQDATNAWRTTWEDFQDFCNKCQVYTNGEILVYVEKNGQLHFSILRGSEIPLEDLNDLKERLLTEHQVLFGWVGKRNKGLKGIMDWCGFEWNGFQMFLGNSHGKVLEWHAYFCCQ